MNDEQMNDERLGQAAGEWLRDTDSPPADHRFDVRRAMEDIRVTRQAHRWWPSRAFRRNVDTAGSTDMTEHMPGLIPATDGHTPTVIWRTTTMLSPVKAIAAGALVFALGGVFLTVGPGSPQGEGGPGAEMDDLAQPVEFTAAIGGGANLQGTGATCELVDGVNHCLDARPPVDYIEASDPRLEGRLTVSISNVQYPDHPWLATTTYRIFNGDGVWQGSVSNAVKRGKESPSTVVLTGERGYEGLYAWMDVSDWDAISGVIFPTAPPEPAVLSPVAD